MFRNMRLVKQQLSEMECEEILREGSHGVLSLNGDGGYPYGVPLSYVYCDGRIYFHGARSGYKADAIRNCDQACFTVVAQDQVMPEEYTTYFKSVIAFGRIRLLEKADDKRAALKKLGMKYSSAYESGMTEEIEKKLKAVGVMELTIEHMTGKQAIELFGKQENADPKGGAYIVRSTAVFDSVQDAPRPAAILIKGKKIEKVLPYDCAGYGEYPVLDYGDKLIMSSFLDAHTHIFSGAVSASRYVCASLGKCRSAKECAEMIAEFAAKNPELKRLRGTGWFVGAWGNNTLPNRHLLDEAVPDRPVYLECADAHSMWLNTKALEEAGIVPRPDLENGIVETDENGELTGMLIEPVACEPAMKKYMEFSEEEMLGIHENFQKVLAENGIAALSEMFAEDYTEETYRKYELLKRVDEKEGLSAHVFVYTRLFGYTEFSEYFRMKEHFSSPHFHIAGVKGFIDGVTETYTGLLIEPYTDRPETCGDKLPLWPREKMEQEITAANAAGIQVRLHCIADGSVRMALDMYEKSLRVNGRKDIRNTIEHIENIHPDDLDRFAELSVIPSMQPYHLTLSENDKIIQLGAQRCRYEWPMKTILEHGGRLAIGTDFPVVGLNPFRTVYAAVTRKDDDGVPTGHNPWEAISLPDALKAYTIEASRVYHAEERMGSLEEGKDADLIVLERNLFAIPPEEIQNVTVFATYFEGKKIYQKQVPAETEVH